MVETPTIKNANGRSIAMKKHLFSENATGFDEQVTLSKLTHLTKDRPKFHGRNSVKEGNSPKKASEEIRKDASNEFYSNSKSQENHSHNHISLERTKSLPPQTLPKPKLTETENTGSNYHEAETEKEVSRMVRQPDRFGKTGGFRLPGLADIRNSSVLNKYKKGRQDEKTDTVTLLKENKSDVNIETHLEKQTRDNVSEESNKKTTTPDSPRNNPSNSPSNTSRFGGKYSRSFREKLGQRSDSFRRSFNRISNSVVSRTQEKKTEKNALQEKQALLDEDPDEIINRFLNNETKNKNDNSVINENKPKTKRVGLSSQSVRITTVDKGPVSPTYRKISTSPGTVRHKSPVTIETKEEPIETYKKISTDDSPQELSKVCDRVERINEISYTTLTKLDLCEPNTSTTPLVPVSTTKCKYQCERFNETNHTVKNQDENNTDNSLTSSLYENTGSTTNKQSSIQRSSSTPLGTKKEPQHKTFDRTFSGHKFLPFTGKAKQNNKDKSIGSTEDISLYEENLKKSNSRKMSQDSWLGRSGLLDFEKKSEMSTKKNTSKNLNTSKENLLEIDSDDEDHLLDRQIEVTNQNIQQPDIPQRKDSKRRMAGLSGLSFKKKYNFGKI